jgi:hypothetical protein
MGKGYGSFLVAFNFWKSTHIHSLSFLLGTTTINDSQKASSTCCIKLVVKSLSMFCLIIIT